MSLRVLLLAPHPFFVERGSPIADRAVARALLEEGHRVDILTYHEGRAPNLEGAEIHRIPDLPGIRNVPPGLSWKKLVCDTVLVASFLRKNSTTEYDVVHAVEEAVFLAWALRRWRGVPYVYDMDSSLVEQTLQSLPLLEPTRRVFDRAERTAVRDATGVLTICSSLAEQIESHGTGTPVRVAEDASLLDRPPEQESTPRDVREFAEEEIVMYVGNLAPYQGVRLLLRSFLYVAENRPRVHLVVIGGGEALEDLRRSTRHTDCADRIHLLGPRPISRLASYLGVADVLVSPRLRGTNTPMKIYSYLDSGRPVVATRIRAHTQVLDETVARLVEPEASSLAVAISDLLEDPDSRRLLGRRARGLARRRYTREAQRRKVKAFYRNVVEPQVG